MGNWTTVKDWLGLSDNYDAEDPEYDYDEYDSDEDFETSGTVHDRPAVRVVPSTGSQHGGDRHRPGDRTRQRDDWEEGDGGVRVITKAPEPEEPRGIVRPLPTSAKPAVMSPTTFNDVQEMADTFKANQPLILNLQGLDRELYRRLVDFCSGFCYVLEGKMERVTDHVFLLTPHGAVVSEVERQRIKDGDIDS